MAMMVVAKAVNAMKAVLPESLVTGGWIIGARMIAAPGTAFDVDTVAMRVARAVVLAVVICNADKADVAA